MPNKIYGATQAEWDFFSTLAEADLLPVVSNPNAKISPMSTMSDLGKTPSLYNSSGLVSGIPKWAQHVATPQLLRRWRSIPDYGICLQTRTYRAIDVDITDQQEADAVFAFLTATLGGFSRRTRADSSKFLVLVKVTGEDLRKETVKTKHGIIEFLATGQQCVVAGTNPSGARIEWSSGGIGIPTVTHAQYLQLQSDIDMMFGVEDQKPAREGISRHNKLQQAEDNDKLAQYLFENDYVLSSAPGVLHIRCPFSDEHSSESAVSSTSYFVQHTNGYAEGHFHCLHAHCQGRRDSEFRQKIGYDQSDLEFECLPDEQAAVETAAEAEAPKEKAKRFGVVSTSEFLEQKPLTWVIKKLIPTKGIGVIYGPPSSGKTFFALDLAMAAARGIDWRGIAMRGKKKVVYVCAEGVGGFRNRVKAYIHQNGGEDLDHFLVMADRPDLLDQKVMAQVRAEIQKADLVVLDTFASVMSGDENSSVDMGKAIRACEVMAARTDAAVLLIHHTRKDGKEARGHSSMKGSADLEIEVSKHDAGVRGAMVVKSKDGGLEGKEYGFRLDVVKLGEDADGDVVDSCVVVDGPAPDRSPKPKGSKSSKALVQGADIDLTNQG